MLPTHIPMLALCLLMNIVPGFVFAANWNPLPDTGQTTCYDVNGKVINCPATGQPLHGQDGQYQGAAPSYTSQTIGSDLIVIDNNTGLVWQQNTADTNDDGSITSGKYPTGDLLVWADAIPFCNGLTYANFNDWRLPTITELESIVDYGRSNPAMNPIFTSQWNVEPSNYWSSSLSTSKPNDFALASSSRDGGDTPHWKLLTGYVRCVRENQ